MAQGANDIPWWVDLITPAITVFTLLNAGIVWIAKRVFLDLLDEQLEQKHKENQEALLELQKEVHKLREEMDDLREFKLRRRYDQVFNEDPEGEF